LYVQLTQNALVVVFFRFKHEELEFRGNSHWELVNPISNEQREKWNLPTRAFWWNLPTFRVG